MKKTFLLFIVLAAIGTQASIVINQTTEYQTIEGFGASGASKSGTYIGEQPSTVCPSSYLDSVVGSLGMSMNLLELYPNLSPASGEFIADSFPKMHRYLLRKYRERSVDRFIASVYSPPCYMKTSGVCTQGGTFNTSYYQAFADYIVKFARMFKDSIGVDLYAVSLQSSPLTDKPGNSCNYSTAAGYAAMFKAVAPLIKAQLPTLRLFAPEHRGSYDAQSPFFDALLKDDAATRNNIHAFAVHGYADSIAADFTSAPGWSRQYDTVHQYGKQFWMTQASSVANNWTGAIALATDIHTALTFGRVNAWLWGSLNDAVDVAENEQSYCLLATGAPTKRFYAAKHYFQYIRPGAVQVECISDKAGVLATAFIHKNDATLTVVLVNTGTTSQTVNLNVATGTIKPPSLNRWQTTSLGNFVYLGTAGFASSIIIPGSSIVTLFSGMPTAIRPDANFRASPQVVSEKPTRLYSINGRLLHQKHSKKTVSGIIIRKTAGQPAHCIAINR